MWGLWLRLRERVKVKTKEDLQEMLNTIQNKGMMAQTLIKQNVASSPMIDELVHKEFFDWLQGLEFWDE